MGKDSRSEKYEQVLVTAAPHAVTEEGFFAVESKVGPGLIRRCSGSSKEQLIVSPRDFRYTKDKYPVVFDKDEKIYFYSLYNWENTIADVDSGVISRIGRLLTFSKQLPCITWRLWKEMANWDSMVSVATPYPPVGILTNILGYLRRKKRTFWIDTDIEGFWEWQMKSASIPKALYLKLLQIIYSTTVGFCVRTSQETWASGDDVVMRYRTRGNVVKVGWAIPEKGMISAMELEDKIARIHERNLRLMTASTLIPMKGVQYAIEAARIFIKEMGIPASLDIYGEGHMRSILEHMVEQYELIDAVHFKGTVTYGDQFYACLREHDCVLITDLPGPLSRTLFDALAQGTAVIASDTEAYKGVVCDGWDALLVAPGDPAGLAAAVERLHRDRKLLSEIIRNGAETAKKYTVKTPSQSC